MGWLKNLHLKNGNSKDYEVWDFNKARNFIKNKTPTQMFPCWHQQLQLQLREYIRNSISMKTIRAQPWQKIV